MGDLLFLFGIISWAAHLRISILPTRVARRFVVVWFSARSLEISGRRSSDRCRLPVGLESWGKWCWWVPSKLTNFSENFSGLRRLSEFTSRCWLAWLNTSRHRMMAFYPLTSSSADHWQVHWCASSPPVKENIGEIRVTYEVEESAHCWHSFHEEAIGTCPARDIIGHGHEELLECPVAQLDKGWIPADLISVIPWKL